MHVACSREQSVLVWIALSTPDECLEAMQDIVSVTHLGVGTMPMSICGQLQSAAKLQQTQPAGQWRRDSCFSSRRTAVYAVSRQPRRAAGAVQVSAKRGSAGAHAQLAQQAAAGLAASSLAAALLAAPADAAQLQQLLPPAPQHSSSMQLASVRRAVVPELSLADVSLPQINDLPSLNNPWQVGPFCPAASTDRKAQPCCSVVATRCPAVSQRVRAALALYL